MRRTVGPYVQEHHGIAGCKATRPIGRVYYVEKGNEKLLYFPVVMNRRTYTSGKSRTAPPPCSVRHLIVEKTSSRGDCATFAVVEKRLNPSFATIFKFLRHTFHHFDLAKPCLKISESGPLQELSLDESAEN